MRQIAITDQGLSSSFLKVAQYLFNFQKAEDLTRLTRQLLRGTIIRNRVSLLADS
jgi:hypothetical protein